jgi:hypothetical protein
MDDPDCEMTDQEVYQARESGLHCPNRKYMVDLIPVSTCDKCEDPKPVSIFDVDVKLRKLDSGTGRDKRTSLSVEFSDPCPMHKDYEGPVEPMELQKIFTPKPIPEQMKDWKYRGEITNAQVNETEEYGDGK